MLHERGRGAGKKPLPFVMVNCAGLQDTLGGGDFLGHAEGAYTGASGARNGAIAQRGECPVGGLVACWSSRYNTPLEVY